MFDEAGDARLEALGLFCHADRLHNMTGALAFWGHHPEYAIITNGACYIVHPGVWALAKGWYAVTAAVLEQEIQDGCNVHDKSVLQ